MANDFELAIILVIHYCNYCINIGYGPIMSVLFFNGQICSLGKTSYS